MSNEYTPTEAVEQLNYLSTIQFDLDAARRESNVLSSAIQRRSDMDSSGYDPEYDAKQDNAALRVVRTIIDGLQARLDAHVANHGLVIDQGIRSLADDANELGDVIGEYVSAYLTPKEVTA